MEDFNLYMNEVDLSEIRKLCLEKGKPVEIKKRDYFVRQGELSKYAGFIESGIFRDTRIGSDGDEHIVGYCFQNDFVCDYPALIKKYHSCVNIQAVTDCKVYLLSVNDFHDYWETSMDAQRLGRLVAEEVLIEIYGRLLDFYCDTAEQRYISLLKRCPSLPQYIPLKEIASFLGVTPETVSHIRKKILLEKKS